MIRGDAHILFVEDNEATRYTVNRILSGAGFRVSVAETGTKALALACEIAPDIVLLDVRLPDLSGFEVCRILKADPRTSPLPVIILSANVVSTEDRVEGLERGADAYLTHPIAPHELVANVGALLRTRRAEADRAAAQRRIAFMLDVTSALMAPPAQLPEALRALAQRCLPLFADWCIVDRLAPGARTRVVGAASRSAAARLERFAAAGNGRAGAIPAALATGSPQELAEVRSPEDVEEPSSPGHREALEPLVGGTLLVRPILAGGRVLGAIALARSLRGAVFDEPDRAQAAEIAAKLALALDNARLYEDLERALRAREEALAEVSHELRTPLQTVVLGANHLELAAGAPNLANVVRARARSIRDAGATMEALTSDLLDLARIESGRFELALTRCSSRTLIEEAVDAVKLVAREKQLALDGVPPDPDVAVSCDPTRIQQVFANLLGNAIKFSEAGGTIEVGARLLAGFVEFWVRDRGRGIAADDLPHVFERYWQARRTGQRGVGLGLSISKGIVEMHGGTMRVESAPGAGATFLFTLPVAQGG